MPALRALMFLFGLTQAAQAQTSTFACQYTGVGGFAWERSQWRLNVFRLEEPFFLFAENAQLDTQSVATVLGSNSTICRHDSLFQRSICHDELGGYLIYDFATQKGGRSEILGAVSEDQEYRDALSVSTFICQEM